MPEDYIGESDIGFGETLQNHFEKTQMPYLNWQTL
jgi:hypothetical protein